MRRILAELRLKGATKTWFERGRMSFWIFIGNTLRRDRTSSKQIRLKGQKEISSTMGVRDNPRNLCSRPRNARGRRRTNIRLPRNLDSLLDPWGRRARQ